MTNTIRYFTDPGPLAPNVNHAEADAMVAAAAAVWNVPTSSVALAQGGVLAEDVDDSNSLFDGTQVVLPGDVGAANEAQVPVAIVYDADGQITDMLLGPGASDPDSCQENAVSGDVDDIRQGTAAIAHATLVLNGRCVGSAPEQMLQMQYQLARAFGRVLGLSWSQTNDNVFMAQTTVTANQMAFWPLMHPIDVICGDYTYQCMTNPFTLRADDLDALAQLYPVLGGAVTVGKQGTSVDALFYQGQVLFPTGQGMAWVNIATTRDNGGFSEDWQTTSAMTGFEYEQAFATPVNADPVVDSGLPLAGLDAYFVFRRVPLNQVSNVHFTTEAINPLYIGAAAIGPYPRFVPSPSGARTTITDWSALPAGDNPMGGNLYPDHAASTCSPGLDGTEGVPASPDASGWQQGQMCSAQHNSWWSVSVAAGHTWTLEVTATDENGAATMSKAMPVVGAWLMSDPTGTMPTVAAQTAAFNSMAFGMTQMAMDAATSDTVYRVSVSDQFGAGRPDFTYTARVLYGDHVSPATVGTIGGRVTVTGTGFREGDEIWVNGVASNVVSATSTQIVADVPSMEAVGAAAGTPVDLVVRDPETAGSASVPAALSYVVMPDLMQQISAPGAVETGVTSSIPFAVRIVASDGRTPVAGTTVRLTASAATASLGACDGQASCIVNSGINGVVQTTVSGVAPGAVVLTATDIAGGASVQVSLQDTDPVRAVALERATHYVAAGVPDAWSFEFSAAQDGQPSVGTAVHWSFGSLLGVQSADSTTSSDGAASATVSSPGMTAGAVEQVEACAWETLCAAATLRAVDPAQWILTTQLSAAQTVGATGNLQAIAVAVTDAEGHPIEAAPVQVYQRVLGWEGPCDSKARCAAAPVLTSSETTEVSDGEGMVKLVPLQVAGVPQVVEVAIATGMQGFLTLTLVKTP